MRRDHRICIRCSAEERAEISKRSRGLGYTTATFLREFGRYGVVQPIPSINQVQWAKLSGLGSNLNQLTHLAHAGTVSESLAPTLQELYLLLTQIRASLTTRKNLP